MKKNELIKEARRIKLKVLDYNDWSDIVFKLPGDDTVAIVSKKEMYKFNNDYDSFEELDCYQQEKLFNLLTEYASTPIEDREEEKRYRYYTENVEGMTSYKKCWNFDEANDVWFLSNEEENRYNKTAFTYSELKKLGVNISDLQSKYEEVEVKE